MSTEKQQKIHRIINTTMSIVLFIMFLLMINPVINSTQSLYDKVSGLEQERRISSEIAQIVADEGYVPTPYKDSLGYWTVGFGHLIKSGESIKSMTSHEAVAQLRKDYTEAQKNVEANYSWADGEAKLVLINMSYQLGSTRLSKFKLTLAHMKSKEYDLAAGEMLNSVWAKQTPSRAARLAARIMQLEE